MFSSPRPERQSSGARRVASPVELQKKGFNLMGIILAIIEHSIIGILYTNNTIIKIIIST